eukprot:TRINITY_DN10961_c0_g1_i1.p1 TRINITY_DN10961_c0_g1~~TRINITY_DN10961_c0_g1_i1.p1  ORF type:complete len:218 (+),score=24.52 TRINITY_DN10961_c0_g1_i1:380-1033(+)
MSTDDKRATPFDMSTRRTSKRRNTVSSEELHQKTMTGFVPFMSFAHATYTPNIDVVNKLQAVLEAGLKSQKQIALENKLSQTLMSQYMNGATRVKGWAATDLLLDSWVTKFNAQFKVQFIEQKNDGESTQYLHTPLYIQLTVIKLSDQPNFEDTGWEYASSVEAEKNEEEKENSSGGVSLLDDRGGGHSFTEAENLPIYPSCGDWENFDIQRMFYPK